MGINQNKNKMGRKAVSKLFYYISIALTFALAGITLAAGYACNIPPSSSTLMPLVGLIIPVLLIFCLVSMLYWLVRLRFWLLIPLIAICGNWNYLTRIFQPPHEDVGFVPGAFIIATYNVDSFRDETTGETCKAIASFLKKQQADILCFQEFGGNKEFTVDDIKTVLADWKYCVIPEATVDHPDLLQLAIFSKYPILDSQLITYPDSKNCSMWCDIETNGKVIRIFNNHLQTTEVSRNKRHLERELLNSSAHAEAIAFRMIDGLKQNFIKRSHQAETLEQIIDTTSHPILVCGDFNSLPSSYTYRTVVGNKLKDGFLTCGHGYMYTFRYLKRLLRIDYILHSPQLEGLNYDSPELEYSDHNPVLMKLK